MLDGQPQAESAPIPSTTYAKHTIFDTPILNFFTRLGAILFLRAIGWKPGGAAPTAPKFVLIAAPHTSNFDFILLIAIALVFRVKLYWMGKDALFRGIKGPLARFLGGVSIDRSRKNGVVGQTIDLLNSSDRLVITVPAEGTRSKGEYWKSGFYHMAHGAQVPVVMGFLDYTKKVGGFGPELIPTGDIQADMKVIAEFYDPIGARYPDQYTPPRLRG